jgi:hypothetical protein
MHENLVRLKAVNQVLKDLNQDYVFVGGATVSLYAIDTAADMVRPTDDVDVIVEAGGIIKNKIKNRWYWLIFWKVSSSW